MHFFATIVLSLAGQAWAHGLVRSPVTRQPGPAAAAVCGQRMVDFYNADNTSYPEAFQREAGWNSTGYDASRCNLWLCRGYQFGDSPPSAVQAFEPGATVDFDVFIRVPHKGYANVSVVDLGANKIVGEPLKVWDDYADGALFPNLPEDQLRFNVTVPDLQGRCARPGACALQWYWLGQGQTYESCVDFVQGPPVPSFIRGHWRS